MSRGRCIVESAALPPLQAHSEAAHAALSASAASLEQERGALQARLQDGRHEGGCRGRGGGGGCCCCRCGSTRTGGAAAAIAALPTTAPAAVAATASPHRPGGDWSGSSSEHPGAPPAAGAPHPLALPSQLPASSPGFPAPPPAPPIAPPRVSDTWGAQRGAGAEGAGLREPTAASVPVPDAAAAGAMGAAPRAPAPAAAAATAVDEQAVAALRASLEQALREATQASADARFWRDKATRADALATSLQVGRRWEGRG